MPQDHERPERRFDMKRPCTLCPFRANEPAIRFASQERALEIALTGLIHGFPCHKTADYIDDDEPDGQAGYVFGNGTQHCAGYLIMKLNEDDRFPWPGINNDDRILQHIKRNVDRTAPVFANTNDFIRASRPIDIPILTSTT